MTTATACCISTTVRAGILHVSQIAVGEENGLAIWVYGTKVVAGMASGTSQRLDRQGSNGPDQIYRRGNGYVAEKSAAAARATRLPSGHPEAFLEAFANVYCNFADTVRAVECTAGQPDPLALDFPNVDDGLRGMLFIETVIASGKSHDKWTNMPV